MLKNAAIKASLLAEASMLDDCHDIESKEEGAYIGYETYKA